MKHGLRPTKAQKQRIESMGLNCDNWLVIKDTPELFEITHRMTGTIRRILKIGERDGPGDIRKSGAIKTS